MKKITLIAVLISFCVFSIGSFMSAEEAGAKKADKSMSNSEAELRLAMRQIWGLRAILLRDYIVNAMSDSKDTNEARDKLIKNAGDLGASIKPYYGYFAGGILAGFLKKDVAITTEVIKAAKFGNKKSLEWAKKRWYSNAFGLAGFFALTRNQTMKDLKDMLYKHLDLTMGEIESIINKDSVKDLDYYEKDKAHMIMFSDVLVNGLVKQFPKRFI